MVNNDQLILSTDHSALLDFLLTQQSLVLLVVIFGGMLAFMIAEQLFPNTATEPDSVPVSRWLTNWFLAFLNFSAALWLMSYLGTAAWMQSVLPDLQFVSHLPMILVATLLVISVELITYWTHRLFHKVPTLWHIHAVHHMDTELDVTTSHRHHFLEVIAMTLLITLLFIAFGVSIWIAFVYQTLRILLVLFNHSNLRIPAGLDRALRPFIVTPGFHRVHHSAETMLTNSNYGTVVPWFDYLFGTARKPGVGAGSPLGLHYLSSKKQSSLFRVLLLPFMWRHWRIAGNTEEGDKR